MLASEISAPKPEKLEKQKKQCNKLSEQIDGNSAENLVSHDVVIQSKDTNLNDDVENTNNTELRKPNEALHDDEMDVHKVIFCEMLD